MDLSRRLKEKIRESGSTIIEFMGEKVLFTGITIAEKKALISARDEDEDAAINSIAKIISEHLIDPSTGKSVFDVDYILNGMPDSIVFELTEIVTKKSNPDIEEAEKN